jgi:exopolysaccharide biosynthesis predicted pyruvyltransferase EpsI
MDNRERSFSRVIEFLASGEVIVTSSYHGAYWGTLLNRRIILINAFSSKFHGFKHQPPLASEGSWKSKLAEARNYPEALAECRGANLRFSEKVRALLL